MLGLFGVGLVPFGNFDDDVGRAVGDALAAQARLGRDARGFVELVVFGVGGFVAGLQPLMHDDVAGGAGAHSAAGMVEPHVKAVGDVENAAGQAIVAVGDFLRVHLEGLSFAQNPPLIL